MQTHFPAAQKSLRGQGCWGRVRVQGAGEVCGRPDEDPKLAMVTI